MFQIKKVQLYKYLFTSSETLAMVSYVVVFSMWLKTAIHCNNLNTCLVSMKMK